jgi:polysaccharide biosynthesis transport protein
MMVAMADDTVKEAGLGMLLAVWSRRKWLAILVFAAPVAAAVSLIMFLPNVYRSTATVLVDRQQVPEAFVRSTVTSALETRLHTISQEILSRSRLEALINRLGLYSDLKQRVSLEEVIERLRGDIKLELKSAKVTDQREATIAFTLSYQGSEPGTVSAVTNTLAGFYIEENLKARERQAIGTAEFLKVQLEETKKRLDVQEQLVSTFKRRHLGELPQQMETNLATLAQLHAQLRMNADNQTRTAERRQTMSSQLADAQSLVTPSYVGPTGLAAPVPEAVRLAQMKQELARLRTQFSERYPDVVQLAAEVAALERTLAEEKSSEPKTEGKPGAPQPTPPAVPLSPYVLRLKEALSEAQTELKVLKSEESRLRDAIAAYQGRVENVPRREQEYVELSRGYESTRELYQSLMKRYEEAQISESMEQRQKGEQFRVIEPAIPNTQPAAPNRVRLLLMAVAVSLGLAAGAVMLAEYVDTSFHSIDGLRAFSAVPVLVSIPRIVTQAGLRRARWRMRLAASACLIGLVMIVGIGYIVANGNERLVSLLARGGS